MSAARGASIHCSRAAGRRSAATLGALALLALAAASGCKSTRARTEVMLEIDADTAVRERLDTLRVLVDVSDDQGKTWRKRLTKSYDRDDVGDWRKFGWPARLGLVPEGGKVSRRFAVRVQALDPAGQLYVWQQAVAGFEQGRTRALRMTLSASCMLDALDCGDPKCVGTNDCRTCVSGECVEVKLLQLPDFDPDRKGDGGRGSDRDADVSGGRGDGGRDQPDADRDAGPERDAMVDGGAAGTGAPPADAGPDGSDDAGGDAATPPAFHVDSSMPSATDPVQNDTLGAISVTFSDPVDQATVTALTMTVTGDGHPIGGTVTPSARGATFTPSEPWLLAGKYTLALSNAIESAADEPLEPFTLDFSVRDGQWSRKAIADGIVTPSLALSYDGYGVMSWGIEGGSGLEIYASLYSPGAGWGTPFAQLTTLGAGTLGPAVINARHDAAVVWSGISAGQNTHMYTAATGWTGTAGLSPATGASMFLSDSDEMFWVASSTPNGNQLKGYQYTLGASSPALIDVAGTAGNNTSAQLAVIGGAARLVWLHLDGGTGRTQLITGLLDPSSGKGLSPATLNASEPVLRATRDHASAIVVWQQEDPGVAGDSTIWASRITTTSEWSSPVQVSKGASAAQHPAVALDEHGRALATWHQGGVVVAASFDPASGWAAPVTVSPVISVNPDPASVVLAPDGSGLAVWTQDSVSMSINEVWFARYLIGSGWQSGRQARISDIDAGTGSVVSLAMDGAGRAIAGWYQSNKIWVARFE